LAIPTRRCHGIQLFTRHRYRQNSCTHSASQPALATNCCGHTCANALACRWRAALLSLHGARPISTPHSVHLAKHVDMPIASCDFVIAWALGNPHTAREQVATHHQPRNLDIALPPLTRRVWSQALPGSRFPKRDIALASLTSASLVVGTTGGRFSTGGIP
jgi:hypothetical protein